MNLADTLRADFILDDIRATDKAGLFCEMTDYLASRIDGIDRDKVIQSLFDRERLGTTGIGHGVAIPHGKIKGLNEMVVVFGRSVRGVQYNSLDNMPAHLIFLIISPENSAAAHLKLLSSISRLLKSHDLRLSLMKAAGRDEIYRIISDAEKSGWAV